MWDFAAGVFSKLNVHLEPVAGELSSEDVERLISSPICCAAPRALSGSGGIGQ